MSSTDQKEEEEETNSSSRRHDPPTHVATAATMEEESMTGNKPSVAAAVTRSSKMEPMEIAQADDSLDEDDDMESLLPSSSSTTQKKKAGVGVDAQTTHHHDPSSLPLWRQWIQPQPIGNMHILFPEQYFDHSSSWGVLGPHWFGPLCVWLLLVVATHYCARRARSLGVVSVGLCYVFFAISTYLLTDVSFRDPGICLDKEIPESSTSSTTTTTPEGENDDDDDDAAALRSQSQWRWCDFCKVYQPPDGVHCPECNVCIAGYDHHCVWMGTCVGKKNYRQFVKFNMSWLYYVAYVFFWLITFGPLFHQHDK